MRKSFYALIASLSLVAQFSCGPTHIVVESPPAPPPPAQVDPAPDATYQSFYDALSPYGEWINDPEYGYVWMPNVGPEFKPYATNGNWVYTDEGWTWASDYSWGWAAFHYGRWFYEEGYGWMWIPGNEWAPAWVSWRQSPEYFGWAPLGPSVSINTAFGGGYNPPAHYWCFVPQRYLTNPHVTNYYINEQQNVTIIHNTTIVNYRGNNTRIDNYAGGPDPVEVSRVTGAQLRPVTIRGSNTPGENRTGTAFAIYRPRINAAARANNGGMASRPTPARVQPIGNVHPVNSTIYTNNGRYNNNNNRDNNNRGFNNSNAPGNNGALNNNNGNNPNGGNLPGNNNYGNNPNRNILPGNNANGNNPSGNNVNGNNPSGNNNSFDNTRSTVQPYGNRPPGNQPVAQPTAQPGRQAGLQPPWDRNGNQPATQPANPPAPQPEIQPAAGQTQSRPVQPQPGIRQFGNRNNGNRNNGNANPGNANAGNANPNNPPKPQSNPNSGRSNGPRTNGNTGNGSGRPAQPNGHVTGPKPSPNPGQATPANQHKPDPNNPSNHS